MWCVVILLSGIVLSVTSQDAAVLILARGGSKGVRLKNLQIVGGISLLGRAILSAQQAGFRDITVSTDHPFIALEAIQYNASIFKRSSVTATDWAPSIWGATEFMHKRMDVNILILVQATSPFIHHRSLSLSLRKLKYPTPFDCLFSVTRSYKLRWNPNSIEPINFNIIRRPRRQDWSGELIETGAFYFVMRHILERGLLQNNNCTVWEVSQEESFEIDTDFDIALANKLLEVKTLF